MTLKLRPEIEEGLKALAKANGESVESFLQRMVEENQKRTGMRSRLSPHEFTQQFEEWADSFPDVSPIPDDALNRENLYPDRW
jgi:hypothetical protein